MFPRILVYDTACSCRTPSNRVFDCKFLTRTISRHAAPRRGQSVTAEQYRRAACSIINIYLDSTGYFNAQWDTASEGRFSIIPGPRSTIRKEAIVSRRPPVPDSLDLPAALPFPRPFDAQQLMKRAEEIGRTYTGSGYPFVSVTTDLTPIGQHDTIGLVFHIDPDDRYQFSLPRLQGSFSTNRNLILRDLSIKPDALFDSRAIELSLDRLRTRNYITDASTLPPVIAAATDSVPAPLRRIIVPFVINDRSGLGLDGAAGLEIGDNDRPRVHGNVRFAFTNLFHAGEEASLTYTGDRSRQQLDLGYAQPWLFGLPVTWEIGGGLEVVSESYGYMYGDLGLFYEPRIRWQAGVNLTANNVSRTGTGRVDGGNSSFFGADLVLIRNAEPYRDGAWSRELTVATGSGLTRKDRMFSRSHIDFSAGGHLPLPLHMAILARVVSGHIITRENDLVPSEMYRVGGNGSLRGYMEDEFAFRSVMYGQAEYLYYFQSRASVYIFCDGGIGFESDIGLDRSYRKMAGYGIGVRLPARIGSLSVEWARNITDSRSLGRVHVGIQNQFSSMSNTPLSFARR